MEGTDRHSRPPGHDARADELTRPAAEPVLIYAPGLGEYPANTAEGVADVLAAVLDTQHQGAYHSTDQFSITAPKGLRVGRTVIDPDGKPVLHTFELDYKFRLQPASGPAGPPAQPGAVRAAGYAVVGLVGLIRAAGRPAKSPMAKWQLAYGLLAAAALIVLALLSAVAAVVAAGGARWLPDAAEDLLAGDDASRIAVTAGSIAVLLWTLARRRMLAIAVTVQRCMRYLHDERHQATVTQTLDDALDGLRDNGWTGPIHLLGYSFGGLVLFDALVPQEHGDGGSSPLPMPVASVTTIGWPVDAVRLYEPGYITDRVARQAELRWCNVHIPTDVFGSELRHRAGAPDPPALPPGVRVESRRYLHARLSLGQLLVVRGFRSHGGYWGRAQEASCFGPLVRTWVPDADDRAGARAPDPPPAAPPPPTPGGAPPAER